MGNKEIIEALRLFVREREWEQFHSLENLAKSISIESAELLECFQWGDPKDLSSVRDELADVLTYCLLLADKINANPEELVFAKLEKTQAKYPLEKARGKSTKYDQL